MEKFLREELHQLPVFVPEPADLVNLSMNENLFADHEGIICHYLRQIAYENPINAYGPGTHQKLTAKYAEYAGVLPAQVLPGPGSDNLIPVLVNALTKRNMLTFEVDFYRYADTALIMNRQHLKVPNSEGIEGLIHRANSDEAELIMLSNPNNPLGNIYEEKDLIRLLESVEGYVVLDEAYYEYYGKSLAHLIDAYPKLLILRTMSKAWGLAGLRVGFVLGNVQLIQFIKNVAGEHFLTTFSAGIAAVALESYDEMRAWTESTLKLRDDFVHFLKTNDLNVLETHANFVYVATDKAALIANMARENGIVIRAFPQALRITIGREEHMEVLKMSICQALLTKS